MGCKMCKGQEEQQSEFNNEVQHPQTCIYQNDTQNSEENRNIRTKAGNPRKNEEDNELAPTIGRFISETNINEIISESINQYIQNNPLSIPEKFTSNNLFSEKKPLFEFENGNIYSGSWNNKGEMEGPGLFIVKESKAIAEGTWSNGELKYARIFLPSGEIYEGEIDNSTFNGKGKLISNNGEIYEGEFVNGEKNGGAKIRYADGTEFEGQIVNGMLNGNGKIIWDNGTEYQGMFCDNMFQGQGTLLQIEGDKYIGNFEKNLFHGKGMYIHKNGNSYDGNFEYGLRKGKGIYKKFGQFSFEGNWENNLPDGFGKIFFEKNNKVVKGIWHNGIIIEENNDEINNKNEYEKNKNKNEDIYFVPDEMILNTKDLSHIQHLDLVSSQYNICNMPSFLENE